MAEREEEEEERKKRVSELPELRFVHVHPVIEGQTDFLCGVRLYVHPEERETARRRRYEKSNRALSLSLQAPAPRRRHDRSIRKDPPS